MGVPDNPDKEDLCQADMSLIPTSGNPDWIEPGVLFDEAPFAMIIVNHDRRVLHCNKAAAAMAGRAQIASIGFRGGEFLRCIYAFNDPRGCGYSEACESCIVRKTVELTFQMGLDHRHVEAPVYLCAEDGCRENWVQVSTTLVKFPEEEGVLVCLEDISDRKYAEKALKRSQQKFRLVTDTIESVFWISTCGVGEMLFISRAYEKLWENSLDKLYRYPKSFIAAIHADDRDMYLSVLEKYHKKGIAYGCEYRIVRRDGSIRWISEKGYPVLSSIHEAKLMTGVCTDITDLKQTEEALRDKNDELAVRAKLADLLLMSTSDEVFSEIIELLCALFNCQHGYLGYIDEDGDLICPSISDAIWDQCHIPNNNKVFHKTFWAGIHDESLIETSAICRNHELTTPKGHIRLKNMLVVPMVVHGLLVGQIVLANKSSEFTIKDELNLKSIADFITPILKIYLEKEKAQKQLASKAEKLEERNIALKVLLENRDQEKRQLVDVITWNFEKLVLPYFEKLKTCNDKESRHTLLEIVESNMRMSLSHGNRSHAQFYRDFSPMEVQVADLIKADKTSKEIAELLHISPRSVYFHRNNIRKKLNIHKIKANLKTILSSHH